jgi:hypothetical protein
MDVDERHGIMTPLTRSLSPSLLACCKSRCQHSVHKVLIKSTEWSHWHSNCFLDKATVELLEIVDSCPALASLGPSPSFYFQVFGCRDRVTASIRCQPVVNCRMAESNQICRPWKDSLSPLFRRLFGCCRPSIGQRCSSASGRRWAIQSGEDFYIFFRPVDR